MKKPLIMTPGPTYVSEDVRDAMSKEITNPDIDLSFYEFYRETCEKIGQLLNTENKVLILDGEGILGLEAACASLIEVGDRVLCIDNGIFGRGFGDFAKMYGAEVVYFESDYRRGLDVAALEEFLKQDSDFKLATLVHCETPSGILNPVDRICPLLDEHGIISVVDSVSSIGGEELLVDKWKIDIALGGSQKCLSAPPGLTFLSVSDRAWNAVKGRKTPVAGFYCNLGIWENWYENKWFPYTQPISDIYALSKAVQNIIEEQTTVERHAEIAERVRTALESSGLEIYAKDSRSNAVTSVVIPEGLSYSEIYDGMLSEGVMIAGAFDYLAGMVLRIGHMGENCYEEKLYITLKALDKVLRALGVKIKGKIHSNFID